jgi:pre-mRNA-splicing factor ATP-dependent RNA helicase DHX15/PRP43
MNMDIGILDPKGRKKNPLTNESYSKQYKKYALTNKGAWIDLPISKYREEIIQKIQDNRVNIITAGTGAGKTVIIPKCALHALNYEGKVVMTVPKRMLALRNATYAAKTLDVRLGKEVGFKHSNSKLAKEITIEHKGKEIVLEEDEESYSKTDTKLLYATDGTIVNNFLNDSDMTKKNAFNILIMDEVHERSVQIDQLLYLAREALRKNENFKVIITSATLDTELFSEYFSEFNPIISDYAGKKKYEVQKIFLDRKIRATSYIKEGTSIIEKILNQKKKKDKKNQNFNQGSVLFFVPILSDAVKICAEIANKTFKSGTYNPYCVELSGKTSNESKEYAIHIDKYKTSEDGPYDRKIVASTNIAESSITINNLAYVIDSGYEWVVSYDPLRNAKSMSPERISKAQAEQRWGRVGRNLEGRIYCLYTEEEYESFEDFPEPKIKKENLDKVLLNLSNMLENDNQNVNYMTKILNEFIEPPKPEFIQTATDILKTIDCCDKNNNLTPLAKFIKTIPLKPQNARILVEGIILNKKNIAIIMACILEKITSITKIGKLKDLKPYINDTSDLLTIKNVYDAFSILSPKQRIKLCEKDNLSCDELDRLDQKITDIVNLLDERKRMYSKHAIMKIMPSLTENLPKYETPIEYVYHILLSGYSANLSQKKTDKKYRNCMPSIVESFSLSNTGVETKDVKYIIYGSYISDYERSVPNFITKIPVNVINNLKTLQKIKLKNCLKNKEGIELDENVQDDEYYESVIKQLHIDNDFNNDHIFELNIENLPNFKTSLKDDVTDLYPLHISPDLANLPRLDQLLKQFDKEIIDVGFLTDDLEHGTDIIAKKSTDTINLLKIVTYNYSNLKEKYDAKMTEIELKEKSISDFRNNLNKLKSDIRSIIEKLEQHNNQLNQIKTKIQNYEIKSKQISKQYTNYLEKVLIMKNKILPQYEKSIKLLTKSFETEKNLYNKKVAELNNDNKEIEIMDISLEVLKNKLNQIILIKGGGLLTKNVIKHFGGNKLKEPIKMKLDIILRLNNKKKILNTEPNKLFEQFNDDEIIYFFKNIKVNDKFITYSDSVKLRALLKLLILAKLKLINDKVHLVQISNILDIDIKKNIKIDDLKQTLEKRINI